MGDGTDTLIGRNDPIPEGEGPIYVSHGLSMLRLFLLCHG